MKPQNAVYYILRIAVCERLNDRAAAEEDRNKVLPMLYCNAWMLSNLAMQPSSAIKHCNMTVALKPDEWKPYFFRAMTYKQKGNIKQADKDLQKARELGWNGAYPPTGVFFDPAMITSQTSRVGQCPKRNR